MTSTQLAPAYADILIDERFGALELESGADVECIRTFGDGRADGSRADAADLGGKGAALAEMTNLGVPVPPGFTITCRMCDEYLAAGVMPAPVSSRLDAAIRGIERSTGKGFGDPSNPLLVSVRSGAAVSMPGMLETVLNLGLNDETVAGLAEASHDARFAHDAYRRFLQMYGSIVLGVDAEKFETMLAAARRHFGAATDAEIPEPGLRQLVEAFKDTICRATGGAGVPSDPREQLVSAIEAVWRSWRLKKAVDYRRVNAIPDEPGTAVSVVAMVFGNLDAESGTGVAFTRNPSTGEPGLFGEFLSCAQGEDVVAGIRTPAPIATMEWTLPQAYKDLIRVQALLERHYTDMQDIEFTVERGRLFVLQTRVGKRAPGAALRIAADLAHEGIIDSEEAVRRVAPAQLDRVMHAVIDGSAVTAPVCVGLPASPGAGSGIAVFDPDEAERRAMSGDSVILVREETSPEDFHGIVAATALVTARGGMTSHGAVVARGMGKCAVVGCRDVSVDIKRRQLVGDTGVIAQGDWMTVDGGTGKVYAGNLPTVPSEVMRVLAGEMHAIDSKTYAAFRDVLGWADATARMKVRANADTPRDARIARRAGAQGIGLCRTEHMFFEGDRIGAMREMIVARSADERRRALARIMPMQRDDFQEIFSAMDGYPVTIRLLDPPLHEFLPRGAFEVDAMAESLHTDAESLRRRLEALREANPMLGHRGCRLGVTYPEITAMQAQAIFEAARAVKLEGMDVQPEIMVPLVASAHEFEHQRAIIVDTARKVLGPLHQAIPYQVGVMIELPRAALTAGAIARTADFFSFGTNDLTQTTLGVSRDDAGSFLPAYVAQGMLAADPFTTLDLDGVGALVAMASHRGRAARPTLKLGACGEHAGDARSIRFFDSIGLDYVSCSPYRVPLARLAVAHASQEAEWVR